MSKTRTMLALAAYPERGAATRLRVLEMLPYLRARGWEVRFEPFIEDDFFSTFYDSGGRLRKASYLASRLASRLRLAVTTRGVDAVLVQREAALVGPPFTEAILGAVRRIPIIFDFDDAIWHFDLARSAHPVAARLLKRPDKCWATMRRASCILAGSEYLAERAREVSANVAVVPTVVPAAVWTPLPGRLDGELAPGGPVRIGWVGTHSTAHQLELVEPALRRLRDESHDFELHVVGAGEGFSLESVETHARPWRLDQEIDEFRRIDIGLAPMHSEPMYLGKCALKQLQYMAVGVPFVSSWVGGAKDFVVDGENGLVAHDSEDWYRHLQALLRWRGLRRKLSKNGRALVEARYSTERQGPRIADLVESSL